MIVHCIKFLINLLNSFLGLFLLNGEQWQVLRKFFIQKFKGYGLNAVRDDLAGPVYDSLNAAADNLKAAQKNPVNIVEFLSEHCATSMRKILFGETGVTDQEISKMLMAFAGTTEVVAGPNILIMGPLSR